MEVLVKQYHATRKEGIRTPGMGVTNLKKPSHRYSAHFNFSVGLPCHMLAIDDARTSSCVRSYSVRCLSSAILETASMISCAADTKSISLGKTRVQAESNFQALRMTPEIGLLQNQHDNISFYAMAVERIALWLMAICITIRYCSAVVRFAIIPWGAYVKFPLQSMLLAMCV